MNQKSYIGRSLSALPDNLLLWCYQHRVRPTIKAVVAATGYAQSECHIATYTGGSGPTRSAHSFNLPGGGVEVGSGWIPTLEREFQEELPIFPRNQVRFGQSKILAMDSVGTTRLKYRGKLLIIVAINVPVHLFRPEYLKPDGRELGGLCITNVGNAILRIRTLPDTKLDAAAVYKSALNNLRSKLI